MCYDSDVLRMMYRSHPTRKEVRKWGRVPLPAICNSPIPHRPLSFVCSPQSPLPPYFHPPTYTRGTRKSASMSGAAQPRCYAIDDLASYAASERTRQAAPQDTDPNGVDSSNGYHQAAIPPQIQPAASPPSANATENNTPQKEKRHRNKPSLSCEVCTVKKTKCDRVRPECFACQKRKTPCHYSPLADMIEESHRAQGHETPRKRPRTAKKADENSVVFAPDAATPIRLADLANAKRIHAGMPLGPAAAAAAASPVMYHPERPVSRPTDRTPSRSSTGSSPRLLSNIPFSHPTASNLFKVEVCEHSLLCNFMLLQKSE